MSLTTYESEMGPDGSGAEWTTTTTTTNQTTTTTTTTENHETTTFLPMTVKNAPYISHDSNHTTTPRTMMTSPSATANATNFHHRDVTAFLSTAQPSLVGSETTTASAAPNMLIVGLGCSALGILIGIILTCVIWTMYRRHRRHRSIIEKHHASAVIEKNPQERTFEPLDMSLTKSNYGVAAGSSTPGSTRVVQLERLEAMSSTPGAREDVVIPDNHSGSYMRFEPPTPPQMLTTNDEQDHHHVMSPPPNSIPLHEMRHRHLLSNLPTFHGSSVETEESGMDIKQQQAYSNSLIQRDSFSSGRGTGTDSDTIPPPPHSDPPQHHHHHYHNNHHRGKPPQQQTTTTQQKQRVANNSNASSTATSSGWSTTLPGEKHHDDENSEVLSSYFDMHFPNSNGGVDTPPVLVDSRRLSSSSSLHRHHQQRVIEETIDL